MTNQTSLPRGVGQPGFQVLTGQVPYSQEAEEAAVGACLIVATDAFDEMAEFLHGEDFYVLRLQYIWEAMKRLRERNEPIDYLTVQEELRALGRLNEVGGPAYLIQLTNAVPFSPYAVVYGRMVERLALRRRLMVCGDVYKSLAMDEEISTEQVLADAEHAFSALRDSRFDHGNEEWIETVGRLIDAVQGRIDNPDQLMGLPTGFRELDDLLAGFQQTDFLLVAGRPGMGKTSLLLGFALNAMRQGARVGFMSQEMGRDQLVQRLAAMETGINMQKIRLGTLDVKTEWPRFVAAMGSIGPLPFMVDDIAGATATSIRSKALRWKRQQGLDLLIVDYLQLLSPERDRQGFSTDYEDLSYISRAMKLLAKELNIPVLCAAQLNRALEGRQDKRPQLSDLRGSGALEQDADVVMFLYRDVIYNDATEFPNRADVIVAKHRNGPTGVISLHFDKSCTKFSDSRTQMIDLRGLGFTGHEHYDHD